MCDGVDVDAVAGLLAVREVARVTNWWDSNSRRLFRPDAQTWRLVQAGSVPNRHKLNNRARLRLRDRLARLVDRPVTGWSLRSRQIGTMPMSVTAVSAMEIGIVSSDTDRLAPMSEDDELDADPRIRKLNGMLMMLTTMLTITEAASDQRR